MQPKAIETPPFRPITEFILMGLFIAWAVLFVNTIRAGEDSCPLKSEGDTAVYYVSKAIGLIRAPFFYVRIPRPRDDAVTAADRRTQFGFSTPPRHTRKIPGFWLRALEQPHNMDAVGTPDG